MTRPVTYASSRSHLLSFMASVHNTLHHHALEFLHHTGFSAWYHIVVGYFVMPRGNPSPKLAITIDPDIHENILAAAARDGVSVSAWMTIAAREALQRRAGLAAIALWEKQHGRLIAEEMNEARRNVQAQLRTSRTIRRPA